jgi:hypothetical protein
MTLLANRDILWPGVFDAGVILKSIATNFLAVLFFFLTKDIQPRSTANAAGLEPLTRIESR